MKKGIAALAAIAAMVMWLSACGGSSSAGSSPSTHSAPAVPQNPNKKKFDLKTLVGQKWSDASAKLSANGWLSTDYVVKTDDGKMALSGKNWTVTAVSDDSKPIISLKHDTSTPQPSSSSTEPADPRKSALEQKLSTSAALSACRQYGKQQYSRPTTSQVSYRTSPQRMTTHGSTRPPLTLPTNMGPKPKD